MYNKIRYVYSLLSSLFNNTGMSLDTYNYYLRRIESVIQDESERQLDIIIAELHSL